MDLSVYRINRSPCVDKRFIGTSSFGGQVTVYPLQFDAKAKNIDQQIQQRFRILEKFSWFHPTSVEESCSRGNYFSQKTDPFVANMMLSGPRLSSLVTPDF